MLIALGIIIYLLLGIVIIGYLYAGISESVEPTTIFPVLFWPLVLVILLILDGVEFVQNWFTERIIRK